MGERERCFSFILSPTPHENLKNNKIMVVMYEADVGGNAGRGRPRRTNLDQIREVL
jgi:hypothetical protein